LPSQFSDVLRRLRAVPRRLSHRIGESRELARLRQAVTAVQPPAPRATVVFTGLSPGGLNGPGKVDAIDFIPPFAARLARDGVAAALATDPVTLQEAVAKRPAILVHVYREVAYRIDTPEVLEAESRAVGVFNAARTGRVIADKLLTHDALTSRGVPMPSLAPEGRVFSNLRQDSGGAVAVLERIEDADAGRYNTAFVDTRVTHGGRTYYTCMRLVCVGAQILHGYVRARDVTEGSASVHAADTPRDPTLVEMLQQRLLVCRMPELANLAAGVAEAFGPGFYAHDVLVPSDGGPAALCETGFKFNDPAYTGRLAPVAAELPSHAAMFTMNTWAGASAGAFLEECRRLGYLAGTSARGT
jgi:hypothetical protein